MGNEAPVAEMLEISASNVSLPDRARGVLDSLQRWAPVYEASWLAVAVPHSRRIDRIATSGLDRSVVDYLDRPSVTDEIELVGLDRHRAAMSVADFPVAVEELPSWAECLLPAGLRGGLGISLFDAGGLHVGFLGLLTPTAEQPSALIRRQFNLLAPLIARALSPLRSLTESARIVRGATAGVVLLQDGVSSPLPGLDDDDPLLLGTSPIVRIARQTLLDGQLYRCFRWPAGQGGTPGDHVRVTVLAAGSDLPAFVLGMLLLTPDAEGRGLTPRELEVLGLVADGRSNQQIAHRLSVTPRTVAAHLEHILHKLEAPTRTLAAVRAEREGCYVPPSPVPPVSPV